MTVDEEAYIQAVLHGNREAFQPLIEPHVDVWLRIAMAWLGNAADAEDAVQNALVKCYQHLGQFRRQAQFAIWVRPCGGWVEAGAYNGRNSLRKRVVDWRGGEHHMVPEGGAAGRH